MSTNSDKIDFTRIGYEVRKHWYYFLISFILVMGVATLYMMKKSPVYLFHAELLIEQTEGGGAGGGMMQMMKSFSIGGFGGGSVDDELVVMQSRSLSNELVAELELNFDYKEADGFRKKTLYRQTPVRLSAERSLLDTLSAGLKFDMTLYPDGKADVTVKDGMFSTVYEKISLKLPAEVKLPYGMFRIEPTPFYRIGAGEKRSVVATVSNTLAVVERLDDQLPAYVESLKTNLITLDYEDVCIERGKDVLNTKLRLFNERRLKEEKEKAHHEMAFIDERLLTLTGQLSDSEKKLEDFKTANDLVDLGTEAKVLLEQTSANKQSIVGLQTQLAIFDMICEFLDNPANRYSMIPVTSGVEYESAAKSIDAYNQLILERMKLDMSAKQDNKALVTLNKQIDGMRDGVVKTMQKARESAEIAYNDFVREDGKYAVRLRQLPSHERQYLNLLRDRQIKNNLYLFLLEQRENNALKFGAAPIGRIVDSAYNEAKKIAPKGSVVFGVGLILSLMLPLVILVIRAVRMKRIRISNDICSLSEVPVVSGADGSREDSLKKLRNMLLLSGEVKTVTVVAENDTLDVSGFVSMLARAVAGASKRVAVLGMDSEMPPVRCDVAGVDVIDGESGLFFSSRFSERVEELKTSHDFVIICGGTFDDYSLLPAAASLSDRVLAVVEAGVLKKCFLRFDAALARLEKKVGYVLLG